MSLILNEKQLNIANEVTYTHSSQIVVIGGRMLYSALSRRYVLRAGFGALAAANADGIAKADRSGRNVLVCIYLFGANDSNNMVVPLDDPQYSAYASARGNLAIPAGSLLEVTAKNQSRYGFHPALFELRDLYASGALAIAANVGHLHQPMTRAVLLPSGGRSHLPGLIDTSLAFLPGAHVTLGWAAQLAGATVTDPGHNVFTGFPGRDGRPNASLSLVSAGAPMATPGMRESLLRAGHSPLNTTFPDTGLGHRMGQVAGLISAAGSLGIHRQVYFVSFGGFGLSTSQPDLLGELSGAMRAFHAATVEMGMDREVTTFTDTEFNRTLKPDAQGVLGPAWGGHQLVMGSAVLGGDVYGAFPNMALGGPDDADFRGVWVPGTSKHQYHATLAGWSGVPSANLSRLFPRLSAFSQPLLNFVA
jgi:uncharacterized protein (DUF1501 family)